MKATEIAAFLGGPLHGEDFDVAGPASLANAHSRSLVFAAKFTEQAVSALNSDQKLLALLGNELKGKITVSHIVTRNPARQIGGVP